MNRRAIGLAGPAFTPLLSVKDMQKLYPAISEATKAVAQKYAGTAELDPQAVVAYMQQAYNPPTATSPSQDKLLFLAAMLVANKDPNIVGLKKKLTEVIQLRANQTAASIDKAKYQKVLDELPTESKKAQDALDVAMQALTSAVDDTDKAMDAFCGWMQSSIKDAVNNAPGVWSAIGAGLLAVAAAAPTGGASLAAGTKYAYKLSSIADLPKFVDWGNGQAAVNMMMHLTYNVWKGENQGTGGVLEEINDKANPPLVYKGKKISGIRIADDGKPVYCWGGRGVYIKPGSTVLAAVPGTPWDAPGPWKVTTQNVGKGKATRLKYTGPSGKPYGYMPIAPFWNTQVLPRIEKQAALWPPVQAALANLEAVTAAGKEAAAMIAQANQAALVASGKLDEAFAEIKKGFTFGTGFLAGYSDVLVQLSKTLGDVLSTVVTTTKSLDTAEASINSFESAYNKAQSLYTAALPEQDPAKRAIAMQAAAGAASIMATAKTAAEADLAAAQSALAKIAEAQNAALAIKQNNDVGGWTTYFNKVSNTLTKSQPRVQTLQTRLAELGPKSDKFKTEVEAQAQQAVAGTGVPGTGAETTTTTSAPPPPPPEKSSAVPLALSIIGIAAALRG